MGRVSGGDGSGGTPATGPRRVRRSRGRRWLVVVAVTAAVVMAVTLLVDGPPDPVLAPAATASDDGDGATPSADALPGCSGADGADRVPIEGFGEVAFRVSAPDGSVVDGCGHLAATPELRAQGLMGQGSLQGYDAMVFRFDGPSTDGFYMFRTLLPLSIAFVAADGAVVSTTDMDPCPADDASACPTFLADGPYVHAVEVPQGDLPALGIVPGATVAFADGEQP